MTFIDNGNIDECDNYTGWSTFKAYICRKVSGAPTLWGFCLTFRWWSGIDTAQLFIAVEDGGVWYRSKASGWNSNNWSAWKRLSGS